MIEAINKLPILSNIIFIRDFMSVKDSTIGYNSSLSILYSIYLKQAIETYQLLTKAKNQLKCFTSIENNWLNENLSKVSEVIKKSKILIDESDKLKNLSSFIKEQKLSWVPIASLEKEFFISLNILNEESEISIELDEDYKITIVKINNSYQYQIKFAWLNYSNKWSHDLKLTLYFQSQHNVNALLTNKPNVITPSNHDEVLHIFHINDLLPNYILPTPEESVFGKYRWSKTKQQLYFYSKYFNYCC